MDKQWVNKKVKREIQKFQDKQQKKPYNIPKLMGCSRSSSKRQVYSDKRLH